MPEMLELGRLKQKQNRRITPGLSQPGLHGKFQVRRSQECLPKTLKKVGTGGLKRWPGGKRTRCSYSPSTPFPAPTASSPPSYNSRSTEHTPSCGF